MSEKPDEKPEVKVVVENNSYGLVIVLVAIIILGGISTMMSSDVIGGFLTGDEDFENANCGDGIDNDGGGQADRDDPDCYNNPELWEGYDPNRSETISSNDPPGGQP